MRLDLFDKKMWTDYMREDWKACNIAWQDYKMSGVLPDEIPFRVINKDDDKLVQAGLVRPGDQAPSGLCNPKYCSMIHHCPIIRQWWYAHGTDMGADGMATMKRDMDLFSNATTGGK